MTVTAAPCDQTSAGECAGETTSPEAQGSGSAKPSETSGLVTKRRVRRYTPRPTEWVKPGRKQLATVLGQLDSGTERVFTVGKSLPAEKLRQWAMGELPAGWSAGAGHYLDDGAEPVLRYRRPDGRPVDVYSGAAWFGVVADVAPATAQAAMAVVDRELLRTFGCGVLATPATTGREMFVRSIPAGKEWPVLSLEDQALIRSTTPQGRIEVCPAVDEIRELVELDGRLMYGALCWGLGAGPVAIHDDVNEYLEHAPGRYRVTATIPDTWAHVGLLPVKSDAPAGGWCWPSDGGARFETWCDGAELHIALAQGWHVTIHERLILRDRKAKPLDEWAKRLVCIADAYADEPLVRAAIRNVLLHAIGAFAGRPHVITRTVDVAEAAEIPAGVGDVQRAGNWLTWKESMVPAWPEMAHPEWAARVWARARARLLASPGGVGALSVPRPTVIGFLTDAIYLTEDPQWTDDGRSGRFRVKTHLRLAEAAKAPTTLPELIRLRDKETN